MTIKTDIILATMNGEHFLMPQLRSIADQTEIDWHLVATDDGSSDHTNRILAAFVDQHPNQVKLATGPQEGSGRNFMHGLKFIRPDAIYVAFSDQDDVWLPRKMQRAISKLNHIKRPAMYCSRQTICNIDLQPNSLTPPLSHAPTFGNALVQNIAPGNTIVLNRAAVELLKRADSAGIHYHDWWAYQLISGAGGAVIFDETSHILYRQHSQNLLGASRGIKGKLGRIRRLIGRTQAQVMADHTDALSRNTHLLTDLSNHQLSTWRDIHNTPAYQRPSKLRIAGIQRQDRRGRFAFAAALAAGYFRSGINARGRLPSTCTTASEGN